MMDTNAIRTLLDPPDNRISCVYAQHVRECDYATSYIHRKITQYIYSQG